VLQLADSKGSDSSTTGHGLATIAWEEDCPAGMNRGEAPGDRLHSILGCVVSGATANGEHVKKVTVCIRLILFGLTLGLALPIPTAAHAEPISAHHTTQKNSLKRYMKQRKKEAKKTLKAQRKAMKRQNKNRGIG
jgi:hypothetical protein